MIPTQIQDNVVRADTPAVYAFYIVKTKQLYPLALVCDEDDALVGVIGNKELSNWRLDVSGRSCGQLCNRNFAFLKNMDEDAIYKEARNIFAKKNLQVLPVVDENGVPVRLFGKHQAFFRDRYKSLPYASYAHGLMDAAGLATSKGYKRISAIEFGVAGGSGLISLGHYAREIERIFGIGIDVYGFDSAKGLLPPADYRDCTNFWKEGDYKMDFEALQSKLYNEKLVVGDIGETTRTFLTDYDPAPIGFIAVDVDTYTPTAAILDMLLEDDKYFTPTITMYFDDLFDNLEFQGESLAIKEFNVKSETIKISPEHIAYNYMSEYFLRHMSNDMKWAIAFLPRIKWCVRFNHPLFSTTRTENLVL